MQQCSAPCCFPLLLLLILYVSLCHCKLEWDVGPHSLPYVRQLPALYSTNELREVRGDEKLSASLDKYLDQLMPLLNSFIKTPIRLPDYNVSIHTDVAYVVPLFGSFKFYNGQVEDVGKITRSGAAPVTYAEEQLSVALTVAVADVKFSGDFVADLESIGPSGSLSGTIDEITVNVHCTVDVNQLHVKLNRFFLQAGSVDLKVNVLPVLDWFLNTLIDLIVYIIKWPLFAIISGQVRDDLQQLLDSYTALVN